MKFILLADNRNFELNSLGIEQAVRDWLVSQDPKSEFIITSKRLLDKAVVDKANPYLCNKLQEVAMEAKDESEFQLTMTQRLSTTTANITPGIFNKTKIDKWLKIEDDEATYKSLNLKDISRYEDQIELQNKLNSQENIEINSTYRIVMTDPTNILTMSPLSKAIASLKGQQQNRVIIIENEMDNSLAWETRFSVSGLALKNGNQLIPGHAMVVVLPADLSKSYQKDKRVYPEQAIYNDLKTYYTAFTALKKYKEPVVLPKMRIESLLSFRDRFGQYNNRYAAVTLINRISLFPVGVAVFKQNILIVSALQILAAMMAGWTLEEIDFQGLDDTQCKYLQNFFAGCAAHNMSFAAITKTLTALAAGDQKTFDLFAAQNIGMPALWQPPQDESLLAADMLQPIKVDAEKFGMELASALFIYTTTADCNYLVSLTQRLPEGQLKANLQQLIYIRFNGIVEVQQHLQKLDELTGNLHKDEQIIRQSLYKYFISPDQAVVKPASAVLQFLFENVADINYIKALFENVNGRYVDSKTEKDYKAVLWQVLTHVNYLNNILDSIKEPVQKLKYLDELFVGNSKDYNFIKFLQKKYHEIVCVYSNNLMLKSYVAEITGANKGLLNMDISSMAFHTKVPKESFSDKIKNILNQPLYFEDKYSEVAKREIVMRSQWLLIGAMCNNNRVTKDNWRIYIEWQSPGSGLIIRFPASDYAQKLVTYLNEQKGIEGLVATQNYITSPRPGDESTGYISSELHVPNYLVDKYLQDILQIVEQPEPEEKYVKNVFKFNF